jgi:hypothetical protein
VLGRDHLDVAALSGNHFTINPKITVLATLFGGQGNSRILPM